MGLTYIQIFMNFLIFIQVIFSLFFALFLVIFDKDMLFY